VDSQKGDDTTVEYVADLDTEKFGSGFPKDPKNPMSHHPWNINNLRNLKDSLLAFSLKGKISGLTCSWIYMGMLYSTFAWHYEDLMLYSINYMHTGASKIWYAIPGAL